MEKQPLPQTDKDEEIPWMLAGAAAIPTILIPLQSVQITPKTDADEPASLPVGQALDAVPAMPIQDMDVDILQRSAQQMTAADAQAPLVLPQDGEAAVQDMVSLDPAATKQEVDAPARMPKNAPLPAEYQELEATITQERIPGSLENVDEAHLPPPRRVDISSAHAPAQPGAPSKAVQTVTERPVEAVQQEHSAPIQPQIQAEPGAAQIAGAEQDSAPQPTSPAEQVALEATLAQGVGKTHFTMRLKPAELGEVTVRLLMQDGGVVARISATNESARTAIAEQLAQLGDSMREKGIDIRSVELVEPTMGQAAFFNEKGQNQARQEQHGTRKRTITAIQEATEAPAEYENHLAGAVSEAVNGVELDA